MRKAYIKSLISEDKNTLCDMKRYLKYGYGMSKSLSDKMGSYAHCSKEYKEVSENIMLLEAKL